MAQAGRARRRVVAGMAVALMAATGLLSTGVAGIAGATGSAGPATAPATAPASTATGSPAAPTPASPTATPATPTWKSRALPWSIAGPIRGKFDAVSCWATGACVAVGYATLPQSTATGPFVANLVNGSWVQGVLPLPAGATSASLAGISCPAATTCEAVGQYTTTQPHALAERFKNGTWHATTAIDPAGTAGAVLRAVSCASKGRCTAVGTSGGRAFADTLAAATWTASAIPLPTGATAATLDGVTCTAPAACVAVGSATVQAAAAELIESGAAARWSATLPGVAGALKSVACNAPGSCLAVGTAAVELLSGGTWSSGTATTFTTVWCAAGTGVACVVFGSGPRVSTLVGSTWTSESVVGLATALAGTCTEISTCVALSWAHKYTYPTHVSAFTETASTWTSVDLPGPPETALDSISCSARLCVAIGSYVSPTGTSNPYFDVLQNGVWTESPSPLPYTYLSSPSVSCRTTTCVAVWGEQAAVSVGGGSWTLSTLPKPPSVQFIFLSDVSCARAGSCVAVGWRSSVAEILSAGVWHYLALPPRANLSDVDCVAVNLCEAAGTTDTARGLESLVATLRGTTLTTTVLTPAPGATYGSLTSVSCTRTLTTCHAGGGWYYGVGGYPQPLVATLRGGAWTETELPLPPLDDGGSVGTISCTSSTQCVAVEPLLAPETVPRPLPRLLQLSNGTWTVVTLPPPSATTAAVANGVTCTTATWCTVTGYAEGPASPTLPELADFPMVATRGAPSPVFRSAASATATPGTHFTFTVVTHAGLGDALSVAGTLPAGFTFTDERNGTGLLAGTPSTAQAGIYHFHLRADDGLGPVRTQAFTLTVS